jgi:hypothetical protein
MEAWWNTFSDPHVPIEEHWIRVSLGNLFASKWLGDQLSRKDLLRGLMAYARWIDAKYGTIAGAGNRQVSESIEEIDRTISARLKSVYAEPVSASWKDGGGPLSG